MFIKLNFIHQFKFPSILRARKHIPLKSKAIQIMSNVIVYFLGQLEGKNSVGTISFVHFLLI